MPKTIASRLLAAILLLVAIPAAAQLPEPTEAPPAAPADPFRRDTPRSAVTGLIDALAEQDYVLAANYFAPANRDAETGAWLAQALQASLDAGGTLIPFGELSNDPTGVIGDGLPAELERVGVLGGDERTPILLQRTEAEGAPEATSDIDAAAPAPGPVWLISQETIAALEARAGELREAAPAKKRFLIAGAPLADWALLLGVFVALFAVFRLLAAASLAAIRRIVRDPETSGAFCFLHAAMPPLSLLLAVISFRIWGNEAPVSIIARQVILRYTGIVAWVALVWFAIRLVDAVAGLLTSRMDRARRRQAVSVVSLLRRATKLLLIAFAAVAILDTLGLDVTTGIAALGIGGLALALGAQKTVENLVGSVSVIADRPIQVGDFCRVGEVTGTVEDIGMRSTRIRTLDRTVVTIPNGDFASFQIENFAPRDRFLFNPVIGLEYGISSAQLRHGIQIVESALREHPHIAAGARAKLANFGTSALEIEVFAYIAVPDFDTSVEVRQQLLLTILERLEQAGLALAIPTRTVHLKTAPGAEDPSAGPATQTG